MQKNEPKLSLNALRVLERRYLLRNKEMRVVETPDQLFRRVASSVAQAEKKFFSKDKQKEIEGKFFSIMSELQFLPNSPTLMNAGTELGQLSACFVIPVEDSLEGIFGALQNTALIHQTGGGTGFSFSHLRPKGDLVDSTKGIASGPVSFMRIFDTTTEVIVQGGRRRGANMGVLSCNHPDIGEFVQAKANERAFSNFNISVAVTDEFMKAVQQGKDYPLINPRSKTVVKKVPAREIFDLIANMAWRIGDPGIIFIDEINRYNPTPQLGRIESTNPCGELPLLPYESCNLGSLNLSKLVENGSVNWDKLKELVWLGVRFLDDVIEVNKFILPEIEEVTLANRKIGLGVMGFADMLLKLGIPYNSNEAVKIAEKIMHYIQIESRKASAELAKERGAFSNFKGSIYDLPGKPKLRNATCTTVAPTGTISIIADCSSGIEPLFALSFVRRVLGSDKLLEVNQIFEKKAREKGFYSQELMAEVAESGSIQRIKNIPQEIKDIFVTTFDISPEWHLKIQAAFQKYTDNSVSKTINLPASATGEEVKRIFLEAYRLKCKGITVYRYGSKKNQALSFPDRETKREGLPACINVDSEYSGGCPKPYCQF